MSSKLQELENAFSRSPSMATCVALCSCYLERKQLLEAMVVCRKGVKLEPDNPKGKALLAEIYRRQGKPSRAREIALAQIQEGVPCAETYGVLARISLEQGMSEEAVEAFQSALELDPGYADALEALAELREGAAPGADLEEAGAQAPHSVGARPGYQSIDEVFSSQALGFEAGAVEAPGALHAGEVSGRGSLRNTASIAGGLFLLTAVLIVGLQQSALTARQVEENLELLVKTIEPDTYSAYQEGLVFAEAIEVLDPGNATLAGITSYTQAVLGGDHGVEGALARASALVGAVPLEALSVPYGRAAWAQLRRHGGASEEVGRFLLPKIQAGGVGPFEVLEAFLATWAAEPGGEEVVSLRARLLESVTFQTRVHHQLGWYFFKVGDWRRALTAFDKVLNNSHDHIGGMLGKALVLLSLGSGAGREGARNLLRAAQSRSAELESPHWNALSRWVLADVNAHDKDSASRSASETERRSLLKEHPLALFAYREGRIQWERGDTASAMEHYRRAARQDPAAIHYTRALVKACVGLGEHSEALEVVNAAVKRGVADLELQVMVVELQLEQGLEVEWARLDSRARADDVEVVAKARWLQARGFRSSGDAAHSAEFLEEYLESMPRSVSRSQQASLWCELGNAYGELGRSQESRAAYELGVEAHPGRQECKR